MAVYNPKISIVIPVYNGADYLSEAIDCALGQTYSNIEVIVINDGSCDEGQTEKIALSYGDRIRYYFKENGGVSSALNYGIQHMNGEYFSWLSHDDKYEPDKIANSVACLASKADRDKLVILCGGYYINEKSEKIRNMNFYLQNNRTYSGSEVIKSILKHGALNACCMLIPRYAFDECGYFNEELRYNQDMLMWYSIFSNGYHLFVDSDHKDVMYRLHANQTSKNARHLLLHDSYEVCKMIAPRFAEQTTTIYKPLRLFAKRMARLYCYEAVKECITVGKTSGIFTWEDVSLIRIWMIWGFFRTGLKKIYHKIRF